MQRDQWSISPAKALGLRLTRDFLLIADHSFATMAALEQNRPHRFTVFDWSDPRAADQSRAPRQQSDWRDDAELGQMSADGVDHRSLLADEQVTGTMQRQTALLRWRLGRAFATVQDHDSMLAAIRRRIDEWGITY